MRVERSAVSLCLVILITAGSRRTETDLLSHTGKACVPSDDTLHTSLSMRMMLRYWIGGFHG